MLFYLPAVYRSASMASAAGPCRAVATILIGIVLLPANPCPGCYLY